MDEMAGSRAGQIAWRLRHNLPALVCDVSSGERQGVALYTLSDPRDVRAIRYVGQSRAPARRYRQHVGAACLWLAGASPWWMPEPAFVPLHRWIRALYADGARLPFMLVVRWVSSIAVARELERSLIVTHRSTGCALLNCEALAG